MTYTQIAVMVVALTVVLDVVVLRTRLLVRKVFWTAYVIVVFFQLVTNGFLTAFEIVRYDGGAILGSTVPVTATPPMFGDGRILYAPFEDLLFGFALVTQALAWWVYFGRRDLDREPRSGPPRIGPGRS